MMVTLVQQPTKESPVPHRPDDRSSHAHRQLIGYIGVALPVAIILIDWILPTPGFPRWALLPSISAYHYTAAVAVFVGLLVALALFLLTYRGYENEHNWADRAAAIAAGVAALGVAFFPTEPPTVEHMLGWWAPWMKTVHYLSAALLFTMFAVFSLWLFRKKGDGPAPPDKVRRNRVYLVCGIAIIGGMIWTLVNGMLGRAIFLPETVTLIAFAISWLTKGYAHRSIADAVRSASS
jgi:hypothetical protein